MKKLYAIILSLFLVGIYGQNIILQEDFSQGMPSGWEVQSTHKYKQWKAKNYKEFYYISMSAFSGKGKPIKKLKTELITPVISDRQEQCKLKFSFADAYSNGQPLSVFLVDKKGKSIEEIPPENFEKLVNNSSRYDNNFEETPWISLPKTKQDYKIMFVYNSAGAVSTTIQLNSVDVWCK